MKLTNQQHKVLYAIIAFFKSMVIPHHSENSLKLLVTNQYQRYHYI